MYGSLSSILLIRLFFRINFQFTRWMFCFTSGHWCVCVCVYVRSYYHLDTLVLPSMSGRQLCVVSTTNFSLSTFNLACNCTDQSTYRVVRFFLISRIHLPNYQKHQILTKKDYKKITKNHWGCKKSNLQILFCFGQQLKTLVSQIGVTNPLVPVTHHGERCWDPFISWQIWLRELNTKN